MNLRLRLAVLSLGLSAAAILFGCYRSSVTALDITPVQAMAGDELSGGAATVHDAGPDAYALSVPYLSRTQRRAFAVGNSFFNDPWVVAPASAQGRDGLGPLFNATNCSSCHFRDGRGQPPAAPGDRFDSILLRISIPDANGNAVPHPVYGDQLQGRGIPGIAAEADVRIDWQEQPGRYADGEAYSLRRPLISLSNPGYGALPANLQKSLRVAPALAGIGLLEAVPEEDILALTDPDDRNGDGISGRARMVVEPRSGKRMLGRYGWKGLTATIEQQTANAFAGDMGITSVVATSDASTITQTAARAAPNGGEPELSEHKLQRVVEYLQFLAVPASRGRDDPHVLRGQAIFQAIGCVSCHTPQLHTGLVAGVPSLSHQLIRPYTDLLLHDMGEGLADHRPEGEAPDGATGREWRTPALWGLGLIKTVNGHEFLLHDGRARGPAEAILWHQGEAAAAAEKFRTLSKENRVALISYLNSL